MSGHLDIYGTAAAGVLAALALWIWLSGQLAARIRSRLRALPLCLPLLLIAAGYGLFWLAFFSSPGMAVQMHAVRLTVQHVAAPYLPWIGGTWLIASLAVLWPLARRA